MSAKSSRLNSWKEFEQNDHIDIVSKICASKGQVDLVYQLCSPWLHVIVEELHFGSQKTSALTLLPTEVGRISKEFLKWLNEKNIWQELHNRWSQNPDEIKSLPLFFSISYIFFTEEQYPDLKNKDTSLSLKEAINDFSSVYGVEPKSKIVGDMAETLLTTFGDWTQDLPEQIRLPYQLYLDGMTALEIAQLLNTNEQTINKHIYEAKKLIVEAGKEAV